MKAINQQYIVLMSKDEAIPCPINEQNGEVAVAIFTSIEKAQTYIDFHNFSAEAHWFTFEEIKEHCQEENPPINEYIINPEYNNVGTMSGIFHKFS